MSITRKTGERICGRWETKGTTTTTTRSDSINVCASDDLFQFPSILWGLSQSEINESNPIEKEGAAAAGNRNERQVVYLSYNARRAF